MAKSQFRVFFEKIWPLKPPRHTSTPSQTFVKKVLRCSLQACSRRIRGFTTKKKNWDHEHRTLSNTHLEAPVVPFLRLSLLSTPYPPSSPAEGHCSVKPVVSLPLLPTPTHHSRATQMFLSFSPHPSPLLSLPTTSTSKPRARPRPVHASTSAAPSPELLGKSALRRISDKLRSLGYIETTPEPPASDPPPGASTAAGHSSPGEIFVPTPAQLPRHRVGCTLDPSWATGDGEASSAARRQRRGRGRDAASAPPSAAELALPRDELRRLQGIGIKVRKRLKVGKAGITEGIVNGIHERWRNMEVVKIRCEDVWAMNMRRTHEILEVSAPL